MPVTWSPDGSHVWYDFECGRDPVHWVDPRTKKEPRERAHTRLPLFGGTRGVVLIEGEVHAIAPDGEPLW